MQRSAPDYPEWLPNPLPRAAGPGRGSGRLPEAAEGVMMPGSYPRKPSLGPYSLLALVMLLAGAAGLHLWNQRDPVKGKTQSVVSNFPDAKTVCEGRV
jgi:hypothetical protein